MILLVVGDIMKRKKLKKRNILILILIIFLIGFIIMNNKPSTKDKRLKELNNIDQKIDYFNYKNINRYIKYKKKHKNLSNKQVIIDVNIGIDKKYYTNTKKSKYLNTNKVLVNKYNYLGKNYIPNNLENINIKYARKGMKLVKEARIAFEKMAKDAKKDGYNIIAMSSYRSYKYQVDLYNKYKKKDGKEAADTYSARPGYSEHQTGLATDIYNGKTDFNNFEKTKEFKWMQKNAHKYGFILRFPKDKVKQTGYQYESWHYRYVGKKASKYIKKHKLCFEEYYIKKIEEY